MSKITIFWAIVIFLSASIFRLTALDLIEFKTDQANIVLKMEQFYLHPKFFVAGPKTSFYAQNFPLNYYILAAISAPSRDPMVFSGIIALINVLACVLFYLMVRLFYGNFTAVVAALLLSLSPWAILYSRQIWTPDLIIPLTLPFFYFLHRLILKKDQKAILWTALFALLLLQWHPTGMLLSLVAFLTIVVLGVKVNLKYLFLGLLLGLIPAVPYFVHEVTLNCPDCPAYLSYLQKTGEERKFSPEVFFQPLQMVNGLSTTEFLGEDSENFYQSQPFLKILNIIFILSSMILFTGIAFIKKERKYLFLLLIVFLALTLTFISKSPPNSYYQLVIAIPIIILYALAIRFIYNRYKFIGLTVLAVILTANVMYIISYGNFLNQKQFIEGPYGPIYRWTLKELAPLPDSNLAKYQVLFDYFNGLNPQFSHTYRDEY